MKNRIYQFLKSFYYIIPFKLQLFYLVRRFYKPSLRIAAYLKFRGSFRVTIEKDTSMKLYNNNLTTISILFWRGFRSYEGFTIQLWKQFSQESTYIFDIGANVGLYGIISKTIANNSKVFFVEPLERNLLLIKKNISLNGMNLDVFPFALADKESTSTFYDMKSHDNTIGSLKKDFVKKHKHHKEIIPIKVKVTTLDNLIKKNKIPAVDLMKIDVEGLDYEVLKGAYNAIKTYRPLIIIEITDNTTADLITMFFIENNYKYLFFEIDDVNNDIHLQKHIVKKVNRNYILCPVEKENLLLDLINKIKHGAE
jgi:FkbM family methyltransferase